MILANHQVLAPHLFVAHWFKDRQIQDEQITQTIDGLILHWAQAVLRLYGYSREVDRQAYVAATNGIPVLFEADAARIKAYFGLGPVTLVHTMHSNPSEGGLQVSEYCPDNQPC